MAILDTSSVDRSLTTLALLRVNHEAGTGYLSNYLPFVYHCLEGLPADSPIAGRPLRDRLHDEFGLELPLGVVRSLLSAADDNGRVRRDRQTYFPIPEQLIGARLDGARAEFDRRLAALLTAVRVFAAEHFTVEWTIEQAKDQLFRYVDHFSSDLLAAALDGRRLAQEAPHEPDQDAFIFHRFALSASTEHGEWFESLVEVVKGRMLADSLYLEVATGQLSSLEELRVYLDGPVLLYLLGHAGEEIQAPYVEMVEMLKRRGATPCCFEHSVIEGQSILDAAASKVQTGMPRESYFGDVVAYLVQSQLSRVDIEMRSERFESDLDAEGVSVEPMPDRKYALQIDEEEFEERLKRRFPYTRSQAIRRDIDSLTAIHQLRLGQTFRDLGKCKAVFITHNYALFQEGVRLFDDRRAGRLIPHCLYDAAFTTLVWLREPREAPNLPRERVIGDAAAAIVPSDRLWHQYNDEINSLQAQGQIDDAAAAFLRYGDDSRRMLMDMTRGSIDAFTEGTVATLLELYNERVAGELRIAMAAEREAHVQTRNELQAQLDQERGEHGLTAAEVAAVDERIAHVSERFGTQLASVLFWLLVAAFVVGTLLGPHGPLDVDVVGATIQLPCFALAIALGLWSAIAGGSLRRVQSWVARRVTRGAETVLRRLLRDR